MIETHDLRQLSLEGPDLAREYAKILGESHGPILTIGRRPWRRWYREVEGRTGLLLSTAPHFEMLFWLPPGTEPEEDPDFDRECTELFQGYRTALDDGRPTAFAEYADLLRRHIQQQESELYPNLLELLDLERPIRELGYEHRGLLETFARLSKELQDSPELQLSKKRREQYDLDFYHLLEHHLEREQEALLPLRNFLAQG